MQFEMAARVTFPSIVER